VAGGDNGESESRSLLDSVTTVLCDIGQLPRRHVFDRLPPGHRLLFRKTAKLQPLRLRREDMTWYFDVNASEAYGVRCTFFNASWQDFCAVRTRLDNDSDREDETHKVRLKGHQW
jgi:hypothetical protein